MMAMTPVTGQDAIASVWPHIESYVQAAVNRSPDTWAMADLLDRILGGKLDLWVAWDKDSSLPFGFVIVARDDASAQIVLIGGKSRAQWIDRIDIIADQLRKSGLNELTAIVPRGWARDLRDFTHRRYEVVMRL